MRPVRYLAREDGEEVLFCGCKHTADKPFCDGAHNNLLDTYAEDDPGSDENKRIPKVEAKDDGKAHLDGGCYVYSLPRHQLVGRGTLKYCPGITRDDGAQHQTQFYFEAESGESPILGFGDRHVILFVAQGSGEVSISGRRISTGPDTGLHVRPGEAFQFLNRADTALKVFSPCAPRRRNPSGSARCPITSTKTMNGAPPPWIPRRAGRWPIVSFRSWWTRRSAPM